MSSTPTNWPETQASYTMNLNNLKFILFENQTAINEGWSGDVGPHATQSLNGPKKIAMNFLYRVVLGYRLIQIKHFLLPYEGPHYPNYLYN